MNKRKLLCSILIGFMSIASISALAKSIEIKKTEEKITETFKNVDDLLWTFDIFKNQNKTNRTNLNKTKQQKNANYQSDSNEISLNLNVFDRLEAQSKNFIYENAENVDFFRKEFEKEIDEKYMNEIEKLSEYSDPFEYARNILLENDFDESLTNYLDDMEFREYCLEHEIDAQGRSKITNEIIIDGKSGCHTEQIINDLKNNGFGFLVDTGEGGSSSSDSPTSDTLNEENFIMPSPQEMKGPNWAPSETSSVKQLLVLMPEAAVAVLLSSVVIVEAAGAAMTLPFIGQCASAILAALAIILIAIISPYIVKVIEFVIGYFLNVIRGFVNFIQSFFLSYVSYTVENALDIAIDNALENTAATNIPSDDVIKDRISRSIKQNKKAISLLPDRLIVPLGVQDEMLTIAGKYANYVYFENPDYVVDKMAYGYDGVWIINEVFIHYMVLNGAQFLLCSRPSIYYNVLSKELIQTRAYSRELQLIDTCYNYYWNEIPSGFPPELSFMDYVPSFAISRINY